MKTSKGSDSGATHRHLQHVFVSFQEIPSPISNEKRRRDFPSDSAGGKVSLLKTNSIYCSLPGTAYGPFCPYLYLVRYHILSDFFCNICQVNRGLTETRHTPVFRFLPGTGYGTSLNW